MSNFYKTIIGVGQIFYEFSYNYPGFEPKLFFNP